MDSQPRNHVPCPICGKDADFCQPPFGPFCSNRCKMVDFGKWLAEDYRTSEPLRPEHFEEFESMEGAQLDIPQDP